MKRTNAAVLVFSVALLIRLAYVFWDTASRAPLIMDTLDFHNFAMSLLNEGRFASDGMVATRMPGYPVFLALVYKFIHPSTLAVQIVQAILSALACVIVFFSARKIMPDPWPLVTGLVAAGFFDFFAGVTQLLSESISTFTLVLFFWGWLALDLEKKRNVFLLGTLMGVTTMIRPDFGPFVLLSAFLLLKKPIKKSILLITLYWLGCGLFLLPWAVRSSLILKQPVPLTTKGGVELYRGLREMTENLGYLPIDPIPFLGNSETENDRIYKEQAIALYKSTPVSIICKVMVANLIVFVYPFRPAYDWTLVLCLPFWIFGFYVAVRKRASQMYVFLLYVPLYLALYTVLGCMVARHREALAPALVYLVGFGLYQLWEKWGREKFTRYVGFWGVFNIGLWAVIGQVREVVLILRNALFK